MKKITAIICLTAVIGACHSNNKQPSNSIGIDSSRPTKLTNGGTIIIDTMARPNILMHWYHPDGRPISNQQIGTGVTRKGRQPNRNIAIGGDRLSGGTFRNVELGDGYHIGYKALYDSSMKAVHDTVKSILIVIDTSQTMTFYGDTTVYKMKTGLVKWISGYEVRERITQAEGLWYESSKVYLDDKKKPLFQWLVVLISTPVKDDRNTLIGWME